MTQRNYYYDSYTTDFTAQIVERLNHNGYPALVLDQSWFYPTSGGQPADRGTLNGVPVIDVFIRESDGGIVHVMAEDVAGEQVTAQVDWGRRFDHMQQHTGQHILSQAFIRIAGAATIGFHLGEQIVTIDLDTKQLPSNALTEAEALANRVIQHNLPVRAWFPAADELAGLPLRKTPNVTNRLRVVAIGGLTTGEPFDVTACGGTHVRQTGELGLLKILKQEKRSGGLVRIVFVVGQRALADYAARQQVTSELANHFSCSYTDLEAAINRLQSDFKTVRRDLKQIRHQLAETQVAQLLAATPVDSTSGLRVICQAWRAEDTVDLRQLATNLSKTANTIALLGVGGEKARLVFACADLDGTTTPPDMRRLLEVALPVLNVERGGGSPQLAQGGGRPANQTQIEQALALAQAELARLIDSSST